MKILMLTHEYPPYPGGVGRYCEEMKIAAERLGHSFEVLAPSYGRSEQLAEEVHLFEGDAFSYRSLYRATVRLRRLLSNKKKRFDLIHIADWPMLLAWYWSGAHRHARSVMTFHGTDVGILSSSIKLKFLRVNAAIRCLDEMCCNSRYTLILAEKRLLSDLPARRRVTYLGVSDSWRSRPSESSLRVVKDHVDLKNGEVLILTVARLDKRKGHDQSIRGIAQLPEVLRKRIKYLVIGAEVDKGYAEYLRALAAELDVSLFLAGRQPDDVVKAAYYSADVFLLTAQPDPNRIEGFGLVFLEAALTGLVSVASAVHAIPEVVVDGVNGYLCEPTDLESIATALTKAIELSRTDEASNQCIRHAASYSWERCAEMTYCIGVERNEDTHSQ